MPHIIERPYNAEISHISDQQHFLPDINCHFDGLSGHLGKKCAYMSNETDAKVSEIYVQVSKTDARVSQVYVKVSRNYVWVSETDVKVSQMNAKVCDTNTTVSETYV